MTSTVTPIVTPAVTLALETSSRPASIALATGDGAPSLIQLDDGHSHASDLMPNVAQALEHHGFSASDLGLIVVGTGPGSYTGLRVGAAIALGLHRGTGAELLGVPSLQCIAHKGLAPGESGAVVRNAFGGQVYVAAYARSEAGLKETLAPACVPAAEALDAVGAYGIWLADEPGLAALGAENHPEVRATEPDAAGLIDLARAAGPESLARGPESIRPLYLRPFDAKVRRR